MAQGDQNVVRVGQTQDVNEPGWDWINNLARQARAAEAQDRAILEAEKGGSPTLPQRAWAPVMGGVENLGTGLANVGRGIGYLFGQDVDFQAAPTAQRQLEAQAPSSAANFWSTLNTGYVPGSMTGVDPALVELAQLYSDEAARMQPTLDKARGQIQGAYGAAAQQGRQAATGIQRRGEQAATGFERLLGEASQQAGTMAQTTGTDISGLTGPSQGFQDIYGATYGTGMGQAYGTRQGAGIASEEMGARAGQAGAAGGRAAADLQTYWNNLTSGERKQIGAAMIASRKQREQAYTESRQQLATTATPTFTMALDNSKSRKAVRSMLDGIGLTNVPANGPQDGAQVTMALMDWAYNTRGVGPEGLQAFLSNVSYYLSEG